MKTLRLIWIALLLAVAGMGTAQARDSFSFGINIGGGA